MHRKLASAQDPRVIAAVPSDQIRQVSGVVSRALHNLMAKNEIFSTSEHPMGLGLSRVLLRSTTLQGDLLSGMHLCNAAQLIKCLSKPIVFVVSLSQEQPLY